jgi:FixJ family two-component response regulator
MLKGKPILIVDDEKNIRLTLSQSLEQLGVEINAAVNGEEALAKLKEKEFGLILLDLKMPGIDGMEVLRQVTKIRPDIRIIIITAHGTIESAVEAMRLGAVDFIQKPFTPIEIRELVSRVIDREKLDEKKLIDYASNLEYAKKCMGERHFAAATEYLNKALSLDPSRPEAFNLLGVIQETQGDVLEAMKNYRAALSLDPTYVPAQTNLDRATTLRPQKKIVLGVTKKRKSRKAK